MSHSAATASRAQITHSRAASREWDGNPLGAQIGGYARLIQAQGGSRSVSPLHRCHGSGRVPRMADAEVAKAHELIESGGVTGKVALTV